MAACDLLKAVEATVSIEICLCVCFHRMFCQYGNKHITHCATGGGMRLHGGAERLGRLPKTAREALGSYGKG